MGKPKTPFEGGGVESGTPQMSQRFDGEGDCGDGPEERILS